MSEQKTINTNTLFKTIEASCFTVGPTITAYFVSSFTVDSYGYYYRDIEGGIAIGVFVTALGFALRYWRLEQ